MTNVKEFNSDESYPFSVGGCNSAVVCEAGQSVLPQRQMVVV